MESGDCALDWCGHGACYCLLNKKSSIVLISMVCLLMTLADSVLPEAGCAPRGLPAQFTGLRAHAAALRDVLRVFFQAANVLLITASFFETPGLMQVYVWAALAFIVLGFAAAILGVLLRARGGGRWYLANFLSEVAFLFVLYLCVPLVDAYRLQLEAGSPSEFH